MFKKLFSISLFISLVLVANHTTFASFSKSIMVDNASHQLISVEGKHYRWYFNNKLLPLENQRAVKIANPGLYSVEVVSSTGKIERIDALISIDADGTIHKIYLIGDSTVCNYNASAYPQTGWGQMLPYFIDKASFTVDNRAIGGRSSRSFYEEGRWTTVSGLLKAGDYVFIQFGHNDRDTKPERYTDTAAYKKFLKIYIDDTRAKGAFPVLVSPMIMNAWRGTTLRNVFTEGANDYRGAMKQVADKLKVPFIDLNMKSFNLLKDLGQNYITRFIYHTYVAGEYPNYPDGITDGTHFQEMGAIEMARLVVQGITELQKESTMASLVPALNPLYPLTIKQDVANAGLITRSANYPVGINITNKVIPNANFTFHYWNDATNKKISDKAIYTFKMGNNATSYTAIYQPSLTALSDENKGSNLPVCFPNPFTENIAVTAPGNFNYTFFDMHGNVLESGKGNNMIVAGDHLVTGIYTLKIQSDTHFKIVKVVKK